MPCPRKPSGDCPQPARRLDAFKHPGSPGRGFELRYVSVVTAPWPRAVAWLQQGDGDEAERRKCTGTRIPGPTPSYLPSVPHFTTVKQWAGQWERFPPCVCGAAGLEEMVWSHRGGQRGQTSRHSSHTLTSTSHTHAYSYTPCNHDILCSFLREAAICLMCQHAVNDTWHCG